MSELREERREPESQMREEMLTKDRLTREEIKEVGTTGYAIDPRGVDHPKHYNVHPAGIECIDVIEHMTPNIAFSIKHMWRAGLKPGEATLKDLDKALWYLRRERERLAKMGVK